MNQEIKYKIRKIVTSNVIIVCLAGISIGSGYELYQIKSGYDDNQKEYDELAEEVIEDNNQEDRYVNFDLLKEMNPDTEGWIKYNDTHIDYPVVQGEDNKKYLTESFEGNSNTFGTLFIDAGCNDPFNDFTTIIYGHHMKDGSMFGDIKKLKNEDFCKNHPELELYTEDKDCTLEICAFLSQPADSDIYKININDEQDKEDYINMVKELALYQTDTEINTNDKLVLLSTCAYDFEDCRYIVVCKLKEKTKYLKIEAPLVSKQKILIKEKTR
ncbi:MAG: class B sortase [Bacilli bacterium]|nr:class B sortase [Bacilli bacterium]